MSATPDPRSTSFFAMPIVVSAWARSSSSPSSVAVANAASARRRPSAVSPAISRIRPAKARTRAAAAETESPARASARARCSRTRSCSTPLPEDAREERLRLGCALRVADRQQCVSCDLERFLPSRLVVGPVERDGQLEQEVGPLGVVRPERERVLVLRRRDREAVERRTRDRRPRGGRSRVRSTISSSSPPDARTSSSAELQWYASISA